ncbi:MAG: serine/threonine protein kinase [Anaerolineae bacterium]|nr:serine/threonine protein kinase [Anaerolineae bacterium]
MAASLEGQKLGKYTILEPLGSGGMARVYRAYHAKLDRYVAVKVLRSDLVDDPMFLSRFKQEAQAVAALRHPNIIQVFDFDVEDDLYYMVMELLDGDSLHTRLNDYRIRNDQMPYGEMVRILLDVLDGLDYAHAEGMIHRDIKPANILLTKKGQAVLADFGIAQIIGSTQHTVSGALLGTLNYMAPEQGMSGKCDVRSDIYSMGVVFYEMLTQQPPYDADTPLAILMKHVNDPLPVPHQIDPNIPMALERVVLKALSKDPDDRFQTAAEMAQSLRQAAGEAVLELPDRISLPLSFSTMQSPSESVAVISGTARRQLVDAAFAAEETDASLGPKLEAELAALKHVEKKQFERLPVMVADHNSIEEQRRELTVANAAVTAVTIFISANLIMIMLMGLFDSRGAFHYFWPAELAMIAGGLFYIMKPTRIIWLMIPAGILLGLSFLFTVSNLFNAWGAWGFIWPLVIFLIMGTIWWSVKWAGRGEMTRRKAYAAGHGLSRAAYGLVAFIGLVSIPFGS